MAYQVIIYEDYDGRFGVNLLDGIEIAAGIDGQQGAVFAHAGAGSPGSDVGAVGQLGQAVGTPGAHEVILIVVGQRVRAGALFAREIESGFFAFAEYRGGELAVGVGAEGLAETSLSGGVEGLGVGDDAFRAGVGVEGGGAGDMVGC